jgi:hypothetical protein
VCGAEFVAMKNAKETTRGLGYKMRMLGVEIGTAVRSNPGS